MSQLGENLGLCRSLVIYYGQPWRRRSLNRFYKALVAEGSLVFDIGAHVGSRTRSLLANNARCIAVEPQPKFAQLLTRLFANNDQVTLVKKAVGSKPGTAELHVSSRHPTVSTLSGEWIKRVDTSSGFESVNWDQTVTVQVTTLDDLIDEYGLPEFCKIDVEGMEADILNGLSVAIPIVAVEYIPATIDIALACLERLETLGSYEYNLSTGESHCMLHSHWQNVAKITENLQQIAASNDKSGDLYARLVNTTSENLNTADTLVD